MTFRLQIENSAYLLSQMKDRQWVGLARLEGGAKALAPGLRAIDEARLETAIQLAEDWLAPHAAGLRGKQLEVADATGRLSSGFQQVLLSTERHWNIESLERAFQQVVHLATGRVASIVVQNHPMFVLDLLLLRELAHHGQVSDIHLN